MIATIATIATIANCLFLINTVLISCFLWIQQKNISDHLFKFTAWDFVMW